MRIDDIAVVAFLVAIPASWYWIVRRLREKGRGVVLGQVAAFVASPLAGLAVFSLVTDPVPGAIFAALVFGPVYLMTRSKSQSTEAERCAPAVTEAPSQEFKLSKIAKSVYEAGPDNDGPLKRWNDAKPKGAESYPTEGPSRKSIVHGKRLDVIRFDYLNAKGELASRRVKVTMVGKWQFEGIDLAKREERTFRHDRVIGEITSELTGEVLDPAEWAASIILNNA